MHLRKRFISFSYHIENHQQTYYDNHIDQQRKINTHACMNVYLLTFYFELITYHHIESYTTKMALSRVEVICLAILGRRRRRSRIICSISLNIFDGAYSQIASNQHVVLYITLAIHFLWVQSICTAFPHKPNSKEFYICL